MRHLTALLAMLYGHGAGVDTALVPGQPVPVLLAHAAMTRCRWPAALHVAVAATG